MSPTDYRALVASIQQHEGLSLRPAADTKNSCVIGYGRNLTFTGISRSEAEYLLENDIADRMATLPRAWPPFTSCPAPVQRLLIEMSFQLGVPGLLLFKTFLHALAVPDYPAAAQALRASQLATETPARVADYLALLEDPHGR
jgi:lysozyme